MKRIGKIFGTCVTSAILLAALAPIASANPGSDAADLALTLGPYEATTGVVPSDASVARTVILDCHGTITGIFGGSQSCSKSTSVGLFDSRISHSFAITWAFMGQGTQTFKVRDPVGDYIAGGCASTTLVVLFSSNVSCDAVLLRSIVFSGTHTFSVTQTYSSCLNPLTIFSCFWSNVDTVNIT